MPLNVHLLAQLARNFSALASMAIARAPSPPLSTLSCIGSHRGAIYPLEVIPRRFFSVGLREWTPVPGLSLIGQDVVTLAVTGAMTGGVLAAVATEQRVGPHLQWKFGASSGTTIRNKVDNEAAQGSLSI